MWRKQEVEATAPPNQESNVAVNQQTTTQNIMTALKLIIIIIQRVSDVQVSCLKLVICRYDWKIVIRVFNDDNRLRCPGESAHC